MFIVNYTFRLEFWLVLKAAVHPNKDILLLFTHPHAKMQSPIVNIIGSSQPRRWLIKTTEAKELK